MWGDELIANKDKIKTVGRKRGRKKGPPTEAVTFRFPVGLYRELSDEAKREGRVLNAEIIRFITAGREVLYPKE